jgi:hypothetical protein
MSIRRGSPLIVVLALLIGASTARAQSQSEESRWVVDVGFGVAPSINGNVNSGAIGTLQGQATAILPQSYGDVYGTGIDLRAGGGYRLDERSEIHAMFVYQTADADLVRLGDFGQSSLYAQYSDYKSLGLDIGYRRYVPIPRPDLRVYAEAAIGAAFISRINSQFAAPRSNIIFNSTDFYDTTAAFTWSLSGGVLFRLTDTIDLNGQIGLRHVGGLADVDQFVGTGLESVNNDTARLTFPVVIGVRFHFK